MPENSFEDLVFSLHCGFQGSKSGHQAKAANAFNLLSPLWPHFLLFIRLFETVSSIVQDNLEFAVFLPSQCWDYRCESSWIAAGFSI